MAVITPRYRCIVIYMRENLLVTCDHNEHRAKACPLSSSTSGYLIIISLALVAIVSIVLGLLGPQEADRTGGKCSACSPHLTIGNIQISDILSAIPGFG